MSSEPWVRRQFVLSSLSQSWAPYVFVLSCPAMQLTSDSQALGCVPAAAGYFKAVQAVCQKYGALLILDEVMCGMGRTGTLHAWEQEGVVPDIQTIGKALGGGYQPVAGVLANRRVVEVLERGSSYVPLALDGQPVAIG